VTSLIAVFEAAIWVINVYDKIVMIKRKERKENMEIEKIYA